MHDLGGTEVGEKLPPLADEAFLQWEIEACAVAKLLGRKGIHVVDESRRAIETLPARMYARLRYYEKWACGSAMLCLEKGVFTEAELEAELGSDEVEPPSFVEGATVRVKKETAKIRWRKPHLRTPGYVHGKTGTVVRAKGPYEVPETLAFQGLKPAHATAVLYTVRFRQTDLWPHYAVSDDTLDCDVFAHWLEDATRESAGWTKFGDARAVTHAGYVDSKIETETAAIEAEGAESPYARLHRATCSLCDRKGVFTLEELRAAAEAMDAMAYGQTLEAARLVARAWVDADFKARLLSDAAAAIAADFPDIEKVVKSRGGMGSTLVEKDGHFHGHTDLVVVANTESVHNVVVCTLCSCYPRALLGLPPRYYTSRSYRARVVHEPRAVLEEFGCELPASVTTVRVHDSTADVRFLVLPLRPEGTEHLDEQALALLATRDCLVGLAFPRLGRETSTISLTL